MKAVSTNEQRLRDAGLKVTQARLALMRALNAGHGPFSPEELRARIDSELCDLVTVYRTLSAFEERGLVRRCYFGDGRMRYEIEHGGEHHHHHLICRVCGEVVPLERCALDALETLENSLKDAGYEDISHSLEFFGRCPRCSQAE